MVFVGDISIVHGIIIHLSLEGHHLAVFSLFWDFQFFFFFFFRWLQHPNEMAEGIVKFPPIELSVACVSPKFCFLA